MKKIAILDQMSYDYIVSGDDPLNWLYWHDFMHYAQDHCCMFQHYYMYWDMLYQQDHYVAHIAQSSEPSCQQIKVREDKLDVKKPKHAGLQCSVCNVCINSPKQMKDHCRGVKHRKQTKRANVEMSASQWLEHGLQMLKR